MIIVYPSGHWVCGRTDFIAISLFAGRQNKPPDEMFHLLIIKLGIMDKQQTEKRQKKSTKSKRALRIGVAGPVGTGKSTIVATICRHLGEEFEIGVITNDIYTDEDARFLKSAGVLNTERIRAVETGSCPHTAIRDDVTMNNIAVEDLEKDFAPLDIILIESGGDNLTATFSPALVDAQIFVLDVAGGGDVARKGGPGVEGADLLVINKVDLGPYVDVDKMVDDASKERQGAPILAHSKKQEDSVEHLCNWVRQLHEQYLSGDHTPIDPGPMAPHSHKHESEEHDHAHNGEHSH